MHQKVHLQVYNTAWDEEYAAEASNICSALRNDELPIEHIGSTAVPGLAAKPVLDMMIGVEELAQVDEWKEQLEAIGYEEIHHPNVPERRFFRKGPPGAGTHHLHIYVYQSEAWTSQCMFRDELCTFSNKRQQYERLKRALVRLYPNDRKRYTAAKAPFIQHTIEQAKSRNQQPVVKEKPEEIVSKVFGYITRMHEGEKQVLVFHHSILEAGIQVPEETVQPDEDLRSALFHEIEKETGFNHFSSCELLATDEWESGEGVVHHRFFYKLPVNSSLNQCIHQPAGGGAEEELTFSFFWLPIHQKEVLVPGQADYFHLL